MKIYTSYFYQVRFFPPNLVPLSTAAWPPKYFGVPSLQFVDKNGVINGLDIPPLKPGKQLEGLCYGSCFPKHPEDCEFLKQYRMQLDKLDFKKVMNSLHHLADKIAADYKYNEVNFALMVYEATRNPCSERVVIQQWFRDNGVDIEEWQSNAA